VTSADDLVPLPGGGRSVVHRRGDVVIRDAGPWTPAVHALLRHLEDAGFAAAPRLVGSGLDTEGREMLTFIDGEFTQPGPWSLDGAAAPSKPPSPEEHRNQPGSRPQVPMPRGAVPGRAARR